MSENKINRNVLLKKFSIMIPIGFVVFIAMAPIFLMERVAFTWHFRSFIIMIGTLSAIIILFNAINGKKNSASEMFNKLLYLKIKSNFFLPEKDIQILANQANIECKSSYSTGYYLEKFLATVGVEKNYDINMNIYEKIHGILSEEKTERPFMNAPEEQRRLMIRINNCLEKEDIGNAKIDLKELSSVIIAKQRTYDKNERTNRWSVPLAFVGLALTIVFGLFSIFTNPEEKPESTQIQKEKTETHSSNT